MAISIEFLGCYPYWIADIGNAGTLGKEQVIVSQEKQKVSDDTIPKCLNCYIGEAKQFALCHKKTEFEREQIFEYIKNILSDADFQLDPLKFMNDWTERRGMVGEFRPIEDPAKLFFAEQDCQRLTGIIKLLHDI